MKKSKFRFMAAEVILFVLTLFFVYKIFNQEWSKNQGWQSFFRSQEINVGMH